ncbi:MAG: hypothetical protein LBI90_07855 [Treponema sp.]|jgi:hypothetical protein|nr:hypothetical protein [Treponema sp.]
MYKKLAVAVFILGAFLALPLPASTVSVLVMETGRNGDNPVKEYSTLWEYGILDVFFEAGHIVSNAPILQTQRKTAKELPDEARPDMEEAKEGGADFFVLALLDYESPDRGGAAGKPDTVSLRLFKISGNKAIYQENVSPGTYPSRDEEVQGIKRIARKLVPLIRDNR